MRSLPEGHKGITVSGVVHEVAFFGALSVNRGCRLTLFAGQELHLPIILWGGAASVDNMKGKVVLVKNARLSTSKWNSERQLCTNAELVDLGGAGDVHSEVSKLLSAYLEWRRTSI